MTVGEERGISSEFYFESVAVKLHSPVADFVIDRFAHKHTLFLQYSVAPLSQCRVISVKIPIESAPATRPRGFQDFTIGLFCEGSNLVGRHGAYKENRLASDAVLELELTHAVGLEIITAVKESLIDFFTERIAPYYTGYFGVDMMAYRDKRGNTLLHPFVELNLRMNMGMVARKLADRFLPPETEGRYRVDYYPKPGELHNDHIARLKTNPPRITDGKLLRGYLALTPVSPHSRYRASIEI